MHNIARVRPKYSLWYLLHRQATHMFFDMTSNVRCLSHDRNSKFTPNTLRIERKSYGESGVVITPFQCRAEESPPLAKLQTRVSNTRGTKDFRVRLRTAKFVRTKLHLACSRGRERGGWLAGITHV